MRIALLGPLEVDEGSARLGARDRVVLSALAMNPGHLLTPEQLADAVWGDTPPATWSKSLQGCISRLRKLLGADAIETSAHGYRLRVPSDAVDAVEFDRSARRAEELLTLREFEHARYVATQALGLWRGRPLSELEQWEAGSAEAGRLTELRWELEEVVIEASLAAGHHREVIAQAARMAEAAPLRERRWALLARAQYQAGQQTQALRTLHRIRTILREELGLDPSPDLVALEQAILRQDPGLLVADAPRAREDASPYPGLRAYGEADTESFFGREAEIRTCVERLQTVSLLAVVGPSGSGKSSLLRAGLVPALSADGHEVVVLKPGAHPGDSLAAARPKSRAVLLVDQAEEAFSLCLDDDERREFFDALVAHAEHGRVVLAMRADFTGELAQHPALAGLVERGLVLLGAMSHDGLRSAIEGPARLHGLVLEPGLADLLVHEVEGEPGALPLMSHALRETWLRHEGRTLTVAGYQASGGIRGAVAQSAEALYGQVPDGDRRQLRELVLRLITPGPEGEPVRSRVPRQQAVLTPAQAQLVELMVTARLVTMNQGDLELAHEALVRAWPRLRGWLDDDVEGQRLRHRLTQAAGDWESLGRHGSELYRGARLAAVAEWVNSAHPQLSELEQQFLDASTELAEAEEQSAREQVRRQKRVNRRLQTLALGLALLVAVSLVAGFLAVRQTHAADRAANAAEARRLGTAALTEHAPGKSLMMAVAASRLDPSVSTDLDLHAVLASRPSLLRTTNLAVNATLSQMVATRRGLVVFDRGHGLHALDPTSLRALASTQVGQPRGDIQEVPVAYSDSEDLLVAAAQQPNKHPLQLLDPSTLRMDPRQLPGWPTRSVGVLALGLSDNGRYLAAQMAGCTCVSETNGFLEAPRAMVWDLADRRLVKTIRMTDETPLAGAVPDPTGHVIFLTNPLRAIDTATGQERWRQRDTVFTLLVDARADGRLLATASRENGSDVELVRPEDGSVARALQGLQRNVTALQFSPDGKRLAASGDDGLAIVWKVATGEVLDRIEVGADRVTGVTFSPNGQTLYTAAEPGHQVSAWDLTGRRTFLNTIPAKNSAPIVGGNGRVSHDTTRFLSLSRDDSGKYALDTIIDRADGTAVTLETPRMFQSGAASWSPDDGTIAIGWDRGIVTLVDARTGRQLARRQVARGLVTEVSFSADGRHLVASALNNDIVRLDPKTLEPDGSAVRLPEHPAEVAASPDGRYGFALAGGAHWAPYLSPPIRNFYLADLDTGRVVRSGPAGVANAVYLDYSPDGRHVTVGGRNGEIVVIDVTTGRPVSPVSTPYSGDTFSVRYNDDGSLVTVASTAGDLALLDGRTGELLATAALPPSEPVAVSNFAPDGSIVVTTFGGDWFRWDPSRENAVDFVCSITGRGLTRAEWASVIPNRPWQETCPT